MEALLEQIQVDAGEQQLRARRERIGLAFFWLLVLAYGFFIPAGVSWNTESHLYTAFSIVDRHSLNIDSYQRGLGDKSYWHGHYYSDKAPGLAFLAAPVYGALHLVLGVHGKRFLLYQRRRGKYFLPQDMAYLRFGITYLLIALPSAALAVLLWLFLLRVSGSTGWSLLLAGTYALGTVAHVYSVWYFSHQLCAALLFAAFLLLFYRIRHRPPDRRALLAAGGAGLLASYSIISEYPTIVIAALLGIYLLVVGRGDATQKARVGLAYVAGMVPAVALNAAYNIATFGQPFATGYMHVQSSSYHTNIHGGMLGLASPLSYGIQAPSLDSFWQITFGNYRGIFFFCPVLVLFFAGIVFMRRRRDLRPEWWLCLVVVVLYFLIDASRSQDTNGWSGGSSVASRHLVPMLPFMIVPMMFGFRARIYRGIFVALAAVSTAIMFMTVSATYPFTYTDKNPLVNEVFAGFFHGRLVPNWIYVWRGTLGLTGYGTLLPFFALALCLVARIVWLLHGGPPFGRGRSQTTASGQRSAKLEVS